MCCRNLGIENTELESTHMLIIEALLHEVHVRLGLADDNMVRNRLVNGLGADLSTDVAANMFASARLEEPETRVKVPTTGNDFPQYDIAPRKSLGAGQESLANAIAALTAEDLRSEGNQTK